MTYLLIRTHFFQEIQTKFFQSLTQSKVFYLCWLTFLIVTNWMTSYHKKFDTQNFRSEDENFENSRLPIYFSSVHTSCSLSSGYQRKHIFLRWPFPLKQNHCLRCSGTLIFFCVPESKNDKHSSGKSNSKIQSNYRIHSTHESLHWKRHACDGLLNWIETNTIRLFNLEFRKNWKATKTIDYSSFSNRDISVKTSSFPSNKA